MTVTRSSYQFLAGEKWMVHKELTLSFLIAQLEREWPYSCAVQLDDKLIWLINLTKTRVEISAHEFHQRVAAFIRDYVCVAGVSPVFRDITLIPYALKAADLALRLGRKKDPHYWYYLYEDYRQQFMKNSLLQEMPLSMLVSPTLLFLEEYDRENHTELLKTLKAYLLDGFNMTNAANKIFVHRTTFFRRMEKIADLTGLNLEDESTCQNLLVGFWIME